MVPGQERTDEKRKDRKGKVGGKGKGNGRERSPLTSCIAAQTLATLLSVRRKDQ